MKICVLIKQVPDKNSSINISDKSINIENPVLITNESDGYAVEEAIQIKERSNAEVTVCSMGPESAKQIIKDALSKGADRGLHIHIDNPNSLDPLYQAKVISNAIGDDFDLILSGLQSDDSGNAQMGILIAEYLKMSHASLAMELNTDDDGLVKVKRELEAGWFQWTNLQFPASVTIQSGINKPRYASLKGIMMMKKKPIETVTPEFDGDCKLKIIDSYMPNRMKETEYIDGSSDEIADRIISIIKNDLALL